MVYRARWQTATKSSPPFQKKTLKSQSVIRQKNRPQQGLFGKPTEAHKCVKRTAYMKPPDGYGTTHSTLNGKATHQKRLVIYFRRLRPKCRRTCAALCLCSLIFISNSARLSDELHQDHQQKMRAAIVEASEQDMNDLPPSWIANQVYDAYGNTSVDAHVQYACMEHLKQMARKLLASKFHPDRDEIAQGELFPETLQTRYPIKRKRGEEPVYKLLDALSEIEGYWNVEQLEKAGGARFKHADTLRTFLKVKFSRRRAAND